MRTLTANAVKELYSVESGVMLITLLTLHKDESIGLTQDINIADNFTGRLASKTNDNEIVYGVTSNSIEYQFIPMQIQLPNDVAATTPSAQVVLQDITRIVLPNLRTIKGAVKVTLKVVLSTSPDTVEISYTGLYLTNISYSATQITGTLAMPSLDLEPFPSHSFTPAYFPGLF